MKVTLNDCKAAYEKWQNYKDHAEQHEFIKIMLVETKFKLDWAYKDLCENWDEKHADLFMRAMNIIFESFGIK